MTKALLVTTDHRFIPINDLKTSEITDHINARAFDMVTGIAIEGLLENGAMFVDDEGLLLDEPKPNLFGCLLAQRIIAGDIIITGDEDEDGNLTDLPDLMLTAGFAEEFHRFLIQSPGLYEMIVKRIATMDLTPKVYSMDDWMAMMKAKQN